MIYHATEAARPLPCPVPLSVVLFGEINRNPVKARKVTFARDSIEDFSTAKRHHDRPKTAPTQTAKKPPVFDKYAAVLSKRKWISSSEVADALCSSREAVNKFLSAHREKLHKRQENTGKGFLVNYWKLK